MAIATRRRSRAERNMQEPNEPNFISPNFFLEKLGPEFQGRQTYDAVLYYFGKYFERVKTEPEYTLPWTIVRETKTSFALEDSPARSERSATSSSSTPSRCG